MASLGSKRGGDTFPCRSRRREEPLAGSSLTSIRILILSEDTTLCGASPIRSSLDRSVKPRRPHAGAAAAVAAECRRQGVRREGLPHQDGDHVSARDQGSCSAARPRARREALREPTRQRVDDAPSRAPTRCWRQRRRARRLAPRFVDSAGAAQAQHRLLARACWRRDIPSA